MDYSVPDTSLYGLPSSADDFHGMPYRRLGASGLMVSAVGLGTWKYGFPETGDNSRVNEAAAMSILDQALELGVTFWDTANRYNESSGNSERVLGKWFARNPASRRNIVLATKMMGLMDGRSPNHWGLSRQNILDAVYASLARLDLDYIDVLYFHRPDDRIDPEESICALEDLIRQDLVRYFAVSNYSVAQIEALEQARQRAGSARSRICAVQNSFNILNGENAPHAGVLDYCAVKNISFVAWSPFAQGLLTGRYSDPARVGAGDRLYDQKSLSGLGDEAVLRRLRGLDALAAGLGITAAQLVLAYMLTLPGMGPVIPGASTVAQLESNAAAAQVALTPDQCRAVRELMG